MSNQLIALGFSPWSIKARWALDHHGIRYRYTQYLPMVGAPWLRLKTRKWRGPVTVPVLLAGSHRLTESLDIARFAEQHGTGEPLFPAGRESDVMQWDRRSEDLLGPGRMLTVRALAQDPDALRETLPRPLRKLPGAVALARSGAHYIRNKYAEQGTDDQLIDRMRAILTELREALDGGAYLLGAFSYADIAMAVSLQGIKPPEGRLVPLGRAGRRNWTRDELADEFSDLLAWRDRLYERHYASAARESAA